MINHVDPVTQNLILGFGDAGGAHFPLRILVLVHALIHAGTGGIDTVVAVDNS
jgi:hypothetical protein